jgi:hypothetical protein
MTLITHAPGTRPVFFWQITWKKAGTQAFKLTSFHPPSSTPHARASEGKFTIKYPRGYDPALKRFVTAGRAVMTHEFPLSAQLV